MLVQRQATIIIKKPGFWQVSIIHRNIYKKGNTFYIKYKNNFYYVSLTKTYGAIYKWRLGTIIDTL